MGDVSHVFIINTLKYSSGMFSPFRYCIAFYGKIVKLFYVHQSNVEFFILLMKNLFLSKMMCLMIYLCKWSV